MIVTDNKFTEILDENRTPILVIGVLCIIIITIFMLWFVMKPTYEVLMQAPTEADLAKAVQELENQNIGYKITEDGLNILVQKVDSSNARTALSELGLPYESTVGLELFATSDFGVTEFAQKVNYKRALEGELTRTISSLSEVRYARVHLVIPEKRMFEKSGEDASSAVTLFLRESVSLSEAQVKGIQDLVASSVPMVKAERVTVLDQNGVTLNGNKKSIMGGSYNDLLKEKKSHESYIKQKIERLLIARYRSAVFAVEVDVTLSSVSSKVIEKTILPMSNKKGALTSSRTTQNTSSADKGGNVSKSNEEKYEYGSRVEESINVAGQDEGISVAIFVSKSLDKAEVLQLEELIVAVAGLKKERGDIVSIMAIPEAIPVDINKQSNSFAPETFPKINFSEINNYTLALLSALILSVFIILICFVLLIRKSRDKTKSLTSAQRDILLSKLNEWTEASGNEKI